MRTFFRFRANYLHLPHPRSSCTRPARMGLRPACLAALVAAASGAFEGFYCGEPTATNYVANPQPGECRALCRAPRSRTCACVRTSLSLHFAMPWGPRACAHLRACSSVSIRRRRERAPTSGSHSPSVHKQAWHTSLRGSRRAAPRSLTCTRASALPPHPRPLPRRSCMPPISSSSQATSTRRGPAALHTQGAWTGSLTTMSRMPPSLRSACSWARGATTRLR